MIVIPDNISNRLIELDFNLHKLGQNLYTRKIFKDYEEKEFYNNFHLEVHRDGSFTLHFLKSLLGYMEAKRFGRDEQEVLDELDLLNASVKRKLEKC